MARAYAGFAGRGALPKVTPITWVEGRSGRCLLGYLPPAKTKCKDTVQTEPKQVVDQNAVDVLTQSLEGVVEFGTGTDAAIGRPVAGKTGTTQDNRDAWFAGYTPQLATVVWMGYPIEPGPDKKRGTADDVSPLMHYCGDPVGCRPVHGIDVTGGSFPAAIWSAFMAEVLAAFTRALEEFPELEAGIAVQAYLPDSMATLEHLQEHYPRVLPTLRSRWGTGPADEKRRIRRSESRMPKKNVIRIRFGAVFITMSFSTSSTTFGAES